MPNPAENWRFPALLLLLTLASLALPQLFLPIAVPAFLYVLPGYFLLRIIGARPSPLETVGLSVLLSLMGSTYAIYWMSLAFGYSSLTFYLFFALVSLAGFLVPVRLDKAIIPKIAPVRLSAASVSRALNEGGAVPLLLAALTMAVFGAILLASLWVPSGNGIITGGWNYGDYFIHSAVIQSVNHGNFPPEEPVYAGVPIAYHWFADLHTAIGAKLFGVFPRFIAILDSTIGVGLLSLFTYLLAMRFAGDRKAALVAAFLVIFAGGFGYLRLADEFGKAPVMELLKGDAFDNKGDFFALPSMLPGFLLPQRPIAFGLPALAAVALLVSTGYPGDLRRLLLAGIVLGMMPPFHYYAFLSAAVAAALYFAYYHVTEKTVQKIGNSLIVIAVSFAFAFPFLLSALGRAGGMLGFGFGWVALRDGAFDPVYFVEFYAANLGLAALLAIPAIPLLFYLKRDLKPAGFLALASLALFVLPNIATFSNTQWDMGKFFMCMAVFSSILAGITLSWANRWARVPLIAICCISPLLASVFFVTSGWVGLSSADVAAGEWILANTPENAVFASSTTHATPIDSYAGRLRVLGYQSWVTNYGLDFGSRHADLQALYCGPRDGAAAIMRKYGASYVYVSGYEAHEFGCIPGFQGVPGFTPGYGANGITIYGFA
ncbi:MAG: hypothetical protein PHF51_04380 [Candidatus ainarchaeum sp.]|nr:hypothetical protein [Candidatus ainarchaeum sp.]